MRSEAVAAAQERLEATKAALERRREELRGLERDVREAARAADAAGKAAAGRDADLRRREVCRSAHFQCWCQALAIFTLARTALRFTVPMPSLVHPHQSPL